MTLAFNVEATTPVPLQVPVPASYELAAITDRAVAVIECGLLTKKEREVAWELLGPDPAKIIAPRLRITEKTLKHHIAAICRKLGVSTRIGLWAMVYPLPGRKTT